MVTSGRIRPEAVVGGCDVLSENAQVSSTVFIVIAVPGLAGQV